MGKGGKGDYKRKQKVKKLACLALTVFLVIVIIILAVLYFSLFKPKDPRVQVPTMQLLSLYSAGYPTTISSANLTLVLQVAMYNPNRATFHVQDGSTACLYYYGAQVGFVSLPTGSIPSQSFVTLSIPLTVQGSAPLQGAQFYGDVSSGILQVSTAVTVFGRVTTLNIFTHHASVVSKCNINVSLNARGIVSYTCQRSFPLDT
ncbi:hypothetical protein L7F22_066767 [Adiantum nelumboides]|nr:hypothetical protein [Adiantum nelumboides]